ncbi:MAG: hypothetical protein FJW36_18885 [Acidobacteria bacterium]|nr:hypothetical protein [Acidobacteriota bacterium]
MKPLAIFLTLLFAALLTPEPVFAKKKPAVARPASKPPVHKKFDNRKKKSTLKFGRPKAF